MRFPTLPALLAALVTGVLAVPLSGCGGGTLVDAPAGRPGTPPPIDASRLSADVRRFSAVPADSAARERRVAVAASALRSAGWMPAIDGSFRISAGPPSERVEHVWATLAGREPGQYAELVVVAADLDAATPLAAALETARRLARQAAYEQVPERSVLLALSSAPRNAATGLSDFAARPPWALDAVRHVLYVSSDSTRAAAVLRDAPPLGARVEVIAAPPLPKTGTSRFFTSARDLASATALADTLYGAVLAAAAPDTLTAAAP